MLGARGVGLGLGRINLTDLTGLQNNNRPALARKAEKKGPKMIIKKRVDRETFWVACRAVLIGFVLIVLGCLMATVGYFAKDLATYQTSNNTTAVSSARKLQISSMSYVGPIIMGVGAFILMIACVMTLESRDKHVRIIQVAARVPIHRRLSRKLHSLSTRQGTKSCNAENDTNEVPPSVETNDQSKTSLANPYIRGMHVFNEFIQERSQTQCKNFDSMPRLKTKSHSTPEQDLVTEPRFVLGSIPATGGTKSQKHQTLEHQSNSLDLPPSVQTAPVSRKLSVKSAKVDQKSVVAAEIHPLPNETGQKENCTKLRFSYSTPRLRRSAVARSPLLRHSRGNRVVDGSPLLMRQHSANIFNVWSSNFRQPQVMKNDQKLWENDSVNFNGRFEGCIDDGTMSATSYETVQSWDNPNKTTVPLLEFGSVTSVLEKDNKRF